MGISIAFRGQEADWRPAASWGKTLGFKAGNPACSAKIQALIVSGLLYSSSLVSVTKTAVMLNHWLYDVARYDNLLFTGRSGYHIGKQTQYWVSVFEAPSMLD